MIVSKMDIFYQLYKIIEWKVLIVLPKSTFVAVLPILTRLKLFLPILTGFKDKDPPLGVIEFSNELFSGSVDFGIRM